MNSHEHSKRTRSAPLGPGTVPMQKDVFGVYYMPDRFTEELVSILQEDGAIDRRYRVTLHGPRVNKDGSLHKNRSSAGVWVHNRTMDDTDTVPPALLPHLLGSNVLSEAL